MVLQKCMVYFKNIKHKWKNSLSTIIQSPILVTYSKNISTITLTILEYFPNFQKKLYIHLFLKIFELWFHPYRRIKLLPKRNLYQWIKRYEPLSPSTWSWNKRIRFRDGQIEKCWEVGPLHLAGICFSRPLLRLSLHDFFVFFWEGDI